MEFIFGWLGRSVNGNYNFSVMSQLQQLLLGHIGYSGWATGQILNACSPLDADQLDLDCGASHSSILRTLRHIHDGERVWLRRLEEVDHDRLPPGPAPERGFEYLVESWPVLREGYRHWLEVASDPDLTEEILTILPDGAEFRVPRLADYSSRHQSHELPPRPDRYDVARVRRSAA